MKEKIEEVIQQYISDFGNQDCFRVWVENINNGEKYIVKCSCRVECFGRRTFKYQTTIRA